MSEQALDGLLLFKQESMYYLSGYDTDGFVLFQALFLGHDGGLILVTRSADRVQAAYTSIIDDVRIWMDSQDENPGNDVRDMLQSQGMRGKRIGVEYDAYGLSARRGQIAQRFLRNGRCLGSCAPATSGKKPGGTGLSSPLWCDLSGGSGRGSGAFGAGCFRG